MTPRSLIQFAPSVSSSVKELVSSLLTRGLPSGAEDVYIGRNHVVKTIVDNRPISIKQFRRPHFVNAFVYRFLRKSKSERSYANAVALIERGFSTPSPIAYAQTEYPLTIGLSYYVCDHLPYPTLRFVEDRPDCEAVIEALAQEMVALHKAGIFFRDFSPGNILVEQLPQGGYRFYYIDLNRMEFGVASRTRLMRMFRSLIFHNPTLSQLARKYANGMGLEADLVEAQAMKVHQAFEDEKVRKQALKKRLRPGKNS